MRGLEPPIQPLPAHALAKLQVIGYQLRVKFTRFGGQSKKGYHPKDFPNGQAKILL